MIGEQKRTLREEIKREKETKEWLVIDWDFIESTPNEMQSKVGDIRIEIDKIHKICPHCIEIYPSLHKFIEFEERGLLRVIDGSAKQDEIETLQKWLKNSELGDGTKILEYVLQDALDRCKRLE